MLSALFHLVVELIRQVLGFLLFSYLGLVITAGIAAIIVVVVLQWVRSRKES